MSDLNVTEIELAEALNEAYKKAGHNAYFGAGFYAGFNFAKQILELQQANDVETKDSGLHLQRVVFSEERAEVCDCTHTQACKICGEDKGLDGDFWKNLKQT